MLMMHSVSQTNKLLFDYAYKGDAMKNNILILTRVLTLVIAALLVGSVWGFTTNQDSDIDANLTVTGTLKIGSVDQDGSGVVVSVAENADSDITIPTTKAVKDYVDDRLEATGLWYLKVTGLTKHESSTHYAAQLKPLSDSTFITKQAITPDLVTFNSEAGKLTLASGNKYILTYLTSYYSDSWEPKNSDDVSFYLTVSDCGQSYDSTTGYPYLEQTINLTGMLEDKHFYFCLYILGQAFSTAEKENATLDVLIRKVD